MTNISDVHLDVEAYVIGALDAADRTIFEQHLDTCEPCQREIVSYLPVLEGLREIPLPAPPPLRVPTETAVTKIRRFPQIVFPLAAAVALMIGGFGGAALQRGTTSEMVAVAGMDLMSDRHIELHGNGLRGRAIVGSLHSRTAFVVDGLPQVAPDRAYQVWVNNGTTSSPGMLHRSRQGFEMLLVQGDLLRGARSVTVTLEPAGGSPKMTGVPLVSGVAGKV